MICSFPAVRLQGWSLDITEISKVLPPTAAGLKLDPLLIFPVRVNVFGFFFFSGDNRPVSQNCWFLPTFNKVCQFHNIFLMRFSCFLANTSIYYCLHHLFWELPSYHTRLTFQLLHFQQFISRLLFFLVAWQGCQRHIQSLAFLILGFND